MDLTLDERAEITAGTQKLIEQIQHDGGLKVRKIASYLLFGDYKSKNWNLNRAELALNILIMQYQPDYQFTAAIKLEPMPPGKPPRMIVADGDSGAVMSAVVIGVLERFIVKIHKHRTIKGKQKGERIDEICRACNHTTPSGDRTRAFILENDGSAWDTCCSLALRDLTENPVMDAVYDLIQDFVTPSNAFYDQRSKANKGKTLKLGIDPKRVVVTATGASGSHDYNQEQLARIVMKKRFTTKIRSIRRSGDRGTSILNWIVNFLCWASVLAGKYSFQIIAINGLVVLEVFGKSRRFLIFLEIYIYIYIYTILSIIIITIIIIISSSSSSICICLCCVCYAV